MRTNHRLEAKSEYFVKQIILYQFWLHSDMMGSDPWGNVELCDLDSLIPIQPETILPDRTLQ